MANKQNAWAIFLIGIALLLWQGPKLGLFSLTGITDGYIFMGKSTISLTQPMCNMTEYSRIAKCDNTFWTWERWYKFDNEEICKDDMGSWDYDTSGAGIPSRDDYIVVKSGKPTDCAATSGDNTVRRDIDDESREVTSRNIKGQNFKTEYKYRSQSGYHFSDTSGGIGTIALLGTTFSYNLPEAPVRSKYEETGGIEVLPSVIDPSKVRIILKGVDMGTFDVTGSEVKLSISACGGGNRCGYGSSALALNNPRYQPLLSCVKEPDELLALESFSAGQELGIYSTRYAVQKFCLAHPVIVTSPTGSGTTAEPYQTWVEGRTLTIPADQTWTVFYIMKNDGSLPVTCGEDAFDVKLQKCTKVSGIIQICSQGQFDPALGVCVVQGDSITLCPEGGRYDVSLNVCVYNPPIQYVCEQGTYDSVIGKCIFAPPSEANCPTGTEYDTIRQVCSFTPPTANVCPTGYTYNTQTGRCETNPPTSVVCPSGSTFNAATGYCEQFPLRQIICDAYYAYDSILDKCVRSPPSTVLCPSGYSYDAGSDKCVRFVTTQPICDSEGGVYDSTTGLCYRQVPTQTECSVLGGTYDATKNLCVNIIETKTVCDIDGATYDASKNLCIKTVPTQNVCTTGVLSADGLVCIYTPNTETSCPRNSIYSPGENKCLYTPPTGVKCADGFTYNSGKNVCEGTAKPVCLQNGVYDERLKSCTTLVDVVSACVGGQYIIERNVPKCIMTPGNVCAAGYVFTDGKCVKSTVKPKTPITKFLSDPLFLISVTLIVASIYLYGKKGRR